MVQIVDRQQNKIFTLQEATDLLPLIYRVTEESAKQVKYLMGCLEALPDKQSLRGIEIQDEINKYLSKWQNKMERLGTRPKGMWFADFDSGNGYFCWKFPETEILYKHGYQDGFTGRKLIHKEMDNAKDHHASSFSPNQS